MTTSAESAPTGGDDSLVSRLRVVEEQPLATRASAYSSLHEELARRLEGIDTLADPRFGDEGARSAHGRA